MPELASLCGDGTTARNGRCVAQAQAQVTCGQGTVLQGSECVPSSTLSCGPGTVQQGSECVPSSTLSCGPGTVQQGSECVPSSTLSCGPGTVQQGSECVPSSTLSCGTGTTQVGNSCRADLSKVCGTDTTSAGTTCVSVMTCGEGTIRDGNECRPWTSACGPGTTFSNGKCEVSPGVVCGAGTVWENGKCVKPVPSPTLEAFSSDTALKGGFYRSMIITTGSTIYEYRAAVTDLSQSGAEGWAQSGAALVGEGASVHMKFWGPASISAGTPFVAQISSALSRGECQTSLNPTSKPSEYGSTYANFFGWNATSPSLKVCAIGGSVKVERLSNTARLTFNIQFSDGTVWTDKVFEMPWRQQE
ncbi:hypothetical protein JRI60_07835 [Archangium violaceum]|uniref:hypothetical protein n=1 Tax=Archangium violaceum TaxID=83451 RepID=UPI00194ED93D|nr:hypothetical protein [Archangium violaceum]QRN98931.1 hypothetical protein JRI60_07835 [Archangium violaceum]